MSVSTFTISIIIGIILCIITEISKSMMCDGNINVVHTDEGVYTFLEIGDKHIFEKEYVRFRVKHSETESQK